MKKRSFDMKTVQLTRETYASLHEGTYIVSHAPGPNGLPNFQGAVKAGVLQRDEQWAFIVQLGAANQSCDVYESYGAFYGAQPEIRHMVEEARKKTRHPFG